MAGVLTIIVLERHQKPPVLPCGRLVNPRVQKRSHGRWEVVV